jgi:putative SOS response-associated peptidase YedK
MCDRLRVSPGQYAKLVEAGVVPPFMPDESWPPPRNPFEDIDIWPKYVAPVIHRVDDVLKATAMRQGFPTTKIKGASGKMLEKHVTNCGNYDSPFWRSAIGSPARRCLVPFIEFAEPKPGKDENGKTNKSCCLPE